MEVMRPPWQARSIYRPGYRNPGNRSPQILNHPESTRVLVIRLFACGVAALITLFFRITRETRDSSDEE